MKSLFDPGSPRWGRRTARRTSTASPPSRRTSASPPSSCGHHLSHPSHHQVRAKNTNYLSQDWALKYFLPDLSTKLRASPPELPPRNTPRNSDALEAELELSEKRRPRNSNSFETQSPHPTSPDYMEVRHENLEIVRTITRWRVSRLPPHHHLQRRRNPRGTPRETARTASRLSTRTGRRSTRTEICFTQAALSAPSAFDPLRRASSLSSRVASTASTTFRFSIFRRRKNCFQVLFAPCCAKCSEFIIGRVLKVTKIRYYQSSRRKKYHQLGLQYSIIPNQAQVAIMFKAILNEWVFKSIRPWV